MENLEPLDNSLYPYYNVSIIQPGFFPKRPGISCNTKRGNRHGRTGISDNTGKLQQVSSGTGGNEERQTQRGQRKD